jgi:hypothetical protein
MQPRIAELVQNLDAQHETLRKAVDGVPPERRDKSPAPDRWSVAGVLEHVALLEGRVATLFRSRVAEAKAAGLREETATSSILATFDLNMMLDRSLRLVAPDVMTPKPDANPEASWQALEVTWQDFRKAVLEADGLALCEVMHPHRVFGPLNMYQWIAFTAAHEARHAAQIREIGEQLRAPQ